MKYLLTILSLFSIARAQTITVKEYVDEKDKLILEYVVRYTETEVQANRRFIDAQFAALQDAINKANVANERRFESVNEFRSQLRDQAGTFITRSELWGWLIALAGITIAAMSYAARKKENMKFREGSKEDKIKKVE